MTDGLVPLVPAEADLRGLSFMPLDVIRLLDSDLFALSTGDEFKAALALWCKSWTQIPGGSLPTDDRVLAHLSGSGSKWPKVKAMALRGWVLGSDGRLYHPVVAEKVVEAWERRGEWQERQNTKAERQRRWRDRVKFVSAQLRAAGVTVPQGASLETLERLAQEHDVDVSRHTEASTDASTGPSTRDAPETLIDRDSGQRTGDRGQGTGTNLIGGEPRKRGHRLPDDWSLTPELLAFGVSKGLTDKGVRDSAERFANHWGAATGRNATKLDWDKAFKVWVGNDANDPRHRRAQAPKSPGVW